jgi:hypothetical protein
MAAAITKICRLEFLHGLAILYTFIDWEFLMAVMFCAIYAVTPSTANHKGERSAHSSLDFCGSGSADSGAAGTDRLQTNLAERGHCCVFSRR